MIETREQALQLLPTLEKFISKSQIEAIKEGFASEECQYFFDCTEKLANTFNTMPQTYETDGQGEEAVAFLHYFKGGCDWYITEKDMEAEQLQAFGLADIHVAEIGYISIIELIENDVELDFHFETKAIKHFK